MTLSIMRLATILGTALMASSTTIAAAQPSTVQLEPFSSVKVCAPFSVLIKPGAGYSITLEAEQAVKNAVSTAVGTDGSLTLGTTKVSE